LSQRFNDKVVYKFTGEKLMKLKLILIMAVTTLISQPSFADDPCANEWADYQAALAYAGGNFKDPYVRITLRALRVCRINSGY
jgi:hypothetical protein